MNQSPFGTRGVIEGYYGRPWSHEQRLGLIDELAVRGLNTFVLAPKDDPTLRRDWRSPDGSESLGRLAELVRHGQQAGVELVWTISPGLSMRYADRAELQALLARIEAVTALGVRRVGLLLDDIPMELQHPEDRASYPDLAAAHVDVAGRVAATLVSGTRLIVCPTVYWGRGTEPYLATLGSGLDPRIDIFWTGRAICSPTLDLDDAVTFTRTARRPPTYWDNYPVNDVAMSYELHIGPYQGRDALLWRASEGVLANAMELFEASRIPLATIADYLREPEAYEPEASWQRAMRDVVGEADLDAFALFADNVRASCLEAGDAPMVAGALESALFGLEYGDAGSAAADLAAMAGRLQGAAAHLLRGPVVNHALIDEIRPWLDAFELGAEAIAVMATLAAEGRLQTDGPSELRPFLIRLRRARVRVFGDALEMTLSVLTGTMFRPGEVP